ncbi:MAG: hypothetical protein PHP57_04860 [Sideroxydans sp.]|nr:hypothetical protein [Sideroxydans sp.]
MKPKDIRMMIAAIFAASLVSPIAQADDEPYLTLSTGFDYSTGKYGTTSTTTTTSIPITAIYETGDWSLRLTVPYLIVTGEGAVTVSGRTGGRRGTATTTTTTTKTRTTQSGLGDIVTLASYDLYMNDEADTGLGVTGRIKFGTANKSFGTGLNDYSLQMYSYTQIGDLSPSLSIGYEVVGSSTTTPMNNVFFGVIGTSYSLSDATSIGVDYRYAQQASVTGSEQKDASIYASHRLSDDLYLRGYVMRGFTDSSADNGVGFSVSLTY